MVRCSPWSTSPNSSCSGGGDPKVLGMTNGLTDSAICKKLCMDEKESGCCFQDDGGMCSWTGGALIGIGHSGITSSCSKGTF